jgi:hypothetical protein
MGEFRGDSLAVYYNTVDISLQMTTCTVTEEGAEPPDINITHKGDATEQVLEGKPAAKKTNASVTLFDSTGDDSEIMDFAIQAIDTLFIYPQGHVHTRPQLTLQNARLINRTQEIPFDNAVTISAEFHAKNSITRGTYNSSP